MSGLVDVRMKLAAMLAPLDDDDPDVQSVPVDAIVPPGLIIGWRSPMVEGIAACTAFANLFVLIVGARLDVESGYETVELQYQRILDLTREAGGWHITGDSGPGAAEIGKTLYLACRVDLRTPIGL